MHVLIRLPLEIDVNLVPIRLEVRKHAVLVRQGPIAPMLSKLEF